MQCPGFLMVPQIPETGVGKPALVVMPAVTRRGWVWFQLRSSNGTRYSGVWGKSQQQLLHARWLPQMSGPVSLAVVCPC